MKTTKQINIPRRTSLRTACVAVFCTALVPFNADALSESIGREIRFAKGYDSRKAEAIKKVIEDKRFEFVGGTVSHWDADFGTRLSFTGDAKAVTDMLAAVRSVPGISVRIVLYRGRDEEGRHDSDWQLDYSQAQPDQITFYLNLNSKALDFSKITLPIIPALVPHENGVSADLQCALR